jgi:hypothetical protein
VLVSLAVLLNQFSLGVNDMSLYDWLITYIFNGIDTTAYGDYVVITLVIIAVLFVGLIIKAITGLLNIFIR